MAARKFGLVAFVCFLGLSSPAKAQNVIGTRIVPGSNFNTGFAGTFGVPGTYSNYGVNGQGPYSAPNRSTSIPQTSNNMGGLINSITRQTGKRGSYRNGPASFGATRKRPKL